MIWILIIDNKELDQINVKLRSSLLKRRSPELILLDYINFAHLLALVYWLLLLNYFFLDVSFQYPPKSSGNLNVFLWFQGVLKGNIGTKWINVIVRSLPWSMPPYKKLSFPLRISPVNVRKWKSSFFVQCVQIPTTLAAPCKHMYPFGLPPPTRTMCTAFLLTNPSATT